MTSLSRLMLLRLIAERYASVPCQTVESVESAEPDERLLELAERMTKDIEHKLRPLDQNWTPKRQREYESRVHDGLNLQRCQQALRALAVGDDLPEILQDTRWTKARVLGMVSVNYHDEFSDHSEEAKALREFAGIVNASTEDVQLQRMLNELRASPPVGFFPTPPDVVEMMLDIVHDDVIRACRSKARGCYLLEPSAGIGTLVEAVSNRHPGMNFKTTAYELATPCVEIMQQKSLDIEIRQSDFMDSCPYSLMDVVLMNPPFENKQDIRHVKHAYKWLDAPGVLVAVMSEGPFFRSHDEDCEFRKWLDEVGGESIKLPADAFNTRDAFRRTGVQTRLVTIRKK